jgi:hypothetical protein
VPQAIELCGQGGIEVDQSYQKEWIDKEEEAESAAYPFTQLGRDETIARNKGGRRRVRSGKEGKWKSGPDGKNGEV